MFCCYNLLNHSMQRSLFFIFSFILLSCAPATQAATQPRVITVNATSAAEPWLTELFACANQQSTVLNISTNNPEIYLRVGEPGDLVLPAYQVDEEEILIVTHRESPVQNLSLEEAQALFAGQGDPSVQVWVYASDVDVQILFDQLVMKGRGVTSYARLAFSPQEMSDVLNAESNSVGILPARWKMGNVREIYSAGRTPVLAVTNVEAAGEIKNLITCLSN